MYDRRLMRDTRPWRAHLQRREARLYGRRPPTVADRLAMAFIVGWRLLLAARRWSDRHEFLTLLVIVVAFSAALTAIADLTDRWWVPLLPDHLPGRTDR